MGDRSEERQSDSGPPEANLAGQQPELESKTSAASCLREVISEKKSKSTLGSRSTADVTTEPSTPAIPKAAQECVSPKDYLTGLRLFVVFFGLLLGTFLASLDTTIVATATPAIAAEFKSQDDIGWYAAAFFIPMAVFQSFWGKTYAYMSQKWVFLAAITTFEIGSLICAVSTSSMMLIIGRAIAGVGGAGVFSGVYIIMALIAEPNKSPLYIGLLGAGYGVASAAGPLLGGVFTSTISWRWCFYINLPVGAITIFIMAFFCRMPAHVKSTPIGIISFIKKLDLISVTLAMGAFISFTLACQWGGIGKAWSSPDVIGTLVGFVVLLVALGINITFMGDDGLLVGSIIRRRMVAVGSAYVCLLNGVLNVLLYGLPQYFQVVQGSTALMSGVKNLPLIVLVSVGAMTSGYLFSKFGLYLFFFIGGACLVTIGTGLIYTLDISSSSGMYEGYQAIVGIGVGIVCQIPLMVVQAESSPADMAFASSAVLFFQMIPGAVWVSASQAILNNLFIAKLESAAPALNARAILNLGGEGIRHVFKDEELNVVLGSYMAAIKDSWLLALAMTGLLVIVSGVGQWRNIRPSKDAPAMMA